MMASWQLFGRGALSVLTQKFTAALQSGVDCWHRIMCNMLSGSSPHSLQHLSAAAKLGFLLRTYVARCTSFTHCLSSVASENFVSKLLKILSKGGRNVRGGGGTSLRR